jgi:hypothetical protein
LVKEKHRLNFPLQGQAVFHFLQVLFGFDKPLLALVSFSMFSKLAFCC